MSRDVHAAMLTQVMVAKRNTKVLQLHHQKWVSKHKPVDAHRVSWSIHGVRVRPEAWFWKMSLLHQWVGLESHLQKFFEPTNSCRMSSSASTIEQWIKCATGWAWLWCFNKCTDNCHVMRFWYLPFLLRVKTQRQGLYYLMLAPPPFGTPFS